MKRIIENIQNPCYCSILIWRFVVGYHKKTNTSLPFPLAFIILPIALREDCINLLSSTRSSSGLNKFVEKFSSSNEKKNDILSNINNTAIQLRNLTMQSIQVGASSNLFKIDIENAKIFPITITKYPSSTTLQAKVFECVEKLGEWCAELSLYEISNILKVRF